MAQLFGVITAILSIYMFACMYVHHKVPGAFRGQMMMLGSVGLELDTCEQLGEY